MYWSLILIIILIIYLLHKNKFERRPPRTVYLFITGGFDSTFRLCQLAMSKQYVQGVYLNIPEVDGSIVKRQNVEYELKSIHNAVCELNKMGFGKYIYPLQIVNQCDLSEDITDSFRQLYYKNFFSRPINQYTYMCDISIKMNNIIETGVLCDTAGGVYKSTGKYIDSNTKLIDLELVEKDGNTDILAFRNLRFPLCGISKYQMAEYAKQNGFYHILEKTISCWYPVNGKPCNKCKMCSERVI